MKATISTEDAGCRMPVSAAAKKEILADGNRSTNAALPVRL